MEGRDRRGSRGVRIRSIEGLEEHTLVRSVRDILCLKMRGVTI